MYCYTKNICFVKRNTINSLWAPLVYFIDLFVCFLILFFTYVLFMYLFIIIIVIIIREVLCAQWYVTSHNDSVGGRWPQGHKAQSTNPHKFPSPLQPKKRIIRTTHGRRGPAPQFPTPHQIRGCHNNILEYDLREHQLTVVFSTLTGQHPLSPLQRVV